MLPFLLAIACVSLVVLFGLYWSQRQTPNDDWVSLRARRDEVGALLRSFLRDLKVPERIDSPSSHAQAEVFFKALRDSSSEALAHAEECVAREPSDPEVRLFLCRALLAKGDVDAAEMQVQAAEERGAKGGVAAQLAARVEIEQYLAKIGGGDKGSILMPAEVLALDLHLRLGESGDASAMWMPGQGGEVSQEEAREFVIVHFQGYYRLLASVMQSLSEAPSVEGLYLLGRLAFKCGFSDEGAVLLRHIEEPMASAVEARSFKRDLALTRGEKPVASEASASSGKKVIKLNVLN